MCLHAQIPLACWVMWTPELAANRLIAKTPASVAMLCISAGYFIYDAAVSIVRYEGIAYLLHGVIAGILYTYGAMTGFLSYYGEPLHSSQPEESHASKRVNKMLAKCTMFISLLVSKLVHRQCRASDQSVNHGAHQTALYDGSRLCRGGIPDVGIEHALRVYALVPIHAGEEREQGLHHQWPAHGGDLLRGAQRLWHM